MPAAQLTQDEQIFVNTHSRQVADVLDDLAYFHQSLRDRGFYVLGNTDARIIRKIRPIVEAIEDDVEGDLHQLSLQVFDLHMKGMRLPVADIDGEPLN